VARHLPPRLKPGQGEAFWKDFRENLKPSYDALKKEGMISEYKVWTNVTTDNPHDWDIAVGLMYSNWAAIDQARRQSGDHPRQALWIA
jgi:hypothetical protein